MDNLKQNTYSPHSGHHSVTDPGVQQKLCQCRGAVNERIISLFKNTLGLEEYFGEGSKNENDARVKSAKDVL